MWQAWGGIQNHVVWRQNKMIDEIYCEVYIVSNSHRDLGPLPDKQ